MTNNKNNIIAMMRESARRFVDRKVEEILGSASLPYDPRRCAHMTEDSWFAQMATLLWLVGLDSLPPMGHDIESSDAIAAEARNQGLTLKSRPTRHLITCGGMRFYLYTETSSFGAHLEPPFLATVTSHAAASPLREGISAAQYVQLIQAYADFMDEAHQEYERVIQAQKELAADICKVRMIRKIQQAGKKEIER